MSIIFYKKKETDSLDARFPSSHWLHCLFYWFRFDFNGVLWVPSSILFLKTTSSSFFAFLRFDWVFTGFGRVLLGFRWVAHGVYWIFFFCLVRLGFTGFDSVLAGFRWVLLDILLGFTEFHRVWLSFTGFWLGFTGFYWIFLLGLTEFYTSTLGFTV